MNITITGVFEALTLASQKPNHYNVLSIASEKSVTRMMINDLKATKNSLILEFDDATEESMGYQLVTRKQCEQALQFLQEHNGYFIVHCHAGVSRSTAVVLGYFLSIYNYEKAVDLLFKIRPCAQPNTRIIGFMCEILNQEKTLPLVLDYILGKKQGE